MYKWFRKMFGLSLMGIALLLLVGQFILMFDGGFNGKEGMKFAGFIFGAIIFITSGVLLFMMGLKIFKKRDKTFQEENLLDELPEDDHQNK